MFRHPRAGDGEAERGFTLIELMMVVLIIAMLIAIAIPAFTEARAGADDAAARTILKDSHRALIAVLSDGKGASTVSPASLKASEPAISFQPQAFAAEAATKQISVSVDVPSGTVVLATHVRHGDCLAIRERENQGTDYARLRGSSTCPATLFGAAVWKRDMPDRR